MSDTYDSTNHPQPVWLHEVETCPSTNSWAIEHASQLGHGAVVFTAKQTAGRGQQGRVWHAPAGVLTASFVLDHLPVTQLPGLSLAAGLATIYAVEDLLPESQGMLKLKWPNDLLLNRHKLAGILCEATSRASAPNARVVVGIGLNRCANFNQPDLHHTGALTNAVSLHQVCESVPDEMALLQNLRHYLLQVASILTRSGLATLLPELRHRDALLNYAVTLELPQETVKGQAIGIDAQGRLLIAEATQDAISVRAFASGRVSWR
jgi:BirA family transcriptional regulator, biotin operon repressor / biotin---[acetyl-CoA-carboxylase] ligase